MEDCRRNHRRAPEMVECSGIRRKRRRLISISMDIPSVFVVVFFLSLVLVNPIVAQVNLTSDEDYVGLYSLRNSLGIRKYDWPRRVEPCTWNGVVCRVGRVVSLNFTGFRRTYSGGKNPKFAVNGLQNLTILENFISVGFALPGPIPVWFGTNLAPSISVLDLRQSKITGAIPENIGNLKNLTVLRLSENNLSGPIPSTIQQLSSLRTLDLSLNSFNEFAPARLGNLEKLEFLDVGNNNLGGSILGTIGDLGALVHLDFSDNSFSGRIPDELGTLRRLEFLDLGRNSFDGALPNSLWGLSTLRFLDVSNNKLNGPLSGDTFDVSTTTNNITNTSSSSTFNLSHNFFHGVLPSGIADLSRRLSFLDLSFNYFQGESPFGSASTTASVDSNCLTTSTTSSPQKNSADCERFYRERGLTYRGGEQSPPSPPPPSSTNSSDGISLNQLIYIIAGVAGFVILLFVILLVICLMKRRNRPHTSQPETTTTAIPSRPASATALPSSIPKPPTPQPLLPTTAAVGDSFTYDQLSQFTSNFSDNNLIKHGHSGSFYRGVLENGSVVVVKKFDTGGETDYKSDRYLNEFDFVSRVMHSRLVPFVGHCSENEKLLVYKHMPFGELSSAFYRKSLPESGGGGDGLQSLDWITRSKIAIGVAEALCYLHNDCGPPFVHRDVQATSILLDDKFEVRLGSLSQVCIEEDSSRQNVVARFFRLSLSHSSEPNSSATPPATCAYDVYCFGKVLLELVTGRVGVSGASEEKANESLEQTMPYVNINERGLLAKIVDPSLVVDEDLMDEVWAMAIVAKSCLNSKPTQRPLAKYVLKALENPLKVVRDETHSNSARLRATPSARGGSWNASIFGSWRSPAETLAGANRRELAVGGGGDGDAGSGEQASRSHRRPPSKDIFPEYEKLEDK